MQIRWVKEAESETPEDRRQVEETAREIDCAVRIIVQSAFERTVSLLASRRNVLEAGAKQLLEKETLVEADLQTLRDALHTSETATAPTLVAAR